MGLDKFRNTANVPVYVALQM